MCKHKGLVLLLFLLQCPLFFLFRTGSPNDCHGGMSFCFILGISLACLHCCILRFLHAKPSFFLYFLCFAEWILHLLLGGLREEIKYLRSELWEGCSFEKVCIEHLSLYLILLWAKNSRLKVVSHRVRGEYSILASSLLLE